MKPKKTLILLAVFAILLAAVMLVERRGKKTSEAKEKESYLVDVAAADVEKLEIKAAAPAGTAATAAGPIALAKNDKGDWQITAPLAAKADASEASSLVDAFAKLRFDRVVDKAPADLKTYEIPKSEVTLWVKGRPAPVRVLIGMENPLDKSLFAKREDDPKVVLLPSSLSSTLNKTVFDLREKDVFKFDTAEVKSVHLKFKDNEWQAARTDGGWSLTAPVKSLAARSPLDTLLDSLAGIKAKEFLVEEKKPEDVKKLGLDKPALEVTLGMPASGKSVVFDFGTEGEKSLATTSGSTKIIAVESSVLTGLEKTLADVRDKKVADILSWEADRAVFKEGTLSLAAVKEKAGTEENWVLETPAKDAADGTKVEAFIRKIEGLEAAGFVDAPKSLSPYGLEPPVAEARIRTKDAENKVKETVIFIGREDKEKKQVAVRNAALDYLFLVDSTFLADLPKDAKDWKPEPPKAPAPGEKK